MEYILVIGIIILNILAAVALYNGYKKVKVLDKDIDDKSFSNIGNVLISIVILGLFSSIAAIILILM